MTPPPLVRDAVAAAAPAAAWEPLAPTSTAGGRVWRVGPVHVKLVPTGSPGPGAGDEAQRLTWLQGRAGGPAVLAVDTDERGGWLVTRTIGGVPAHLAERHGDVERVVLAVARTLRQLHELPVADCPFDAGWDVLDAEVARSLDAGLIDTADLGPPFYRYDAARLVELWRQGRPAGPQEQVVVHGDPSLPNVIVDPRAGAGLVDAGRLGVGDRHLDLAVVHASIQRNLGPQAVFAFYDAYGTDPDLVRLEHYRLGALLR